jgi:hypothetical protein
VGRRSAIPLDVRPAHRLLSMPRPRGRWCLS